MEYRMKDIMEPPKTLEEQKKEAEKTVAHLWNIGKVLNPGVGD